MAGVINEPGQHSEQSPATLGAAMDADRNTTRDATRIRLHLGRRTRKAVLTFHIATAGSWLGIDVVIAVFVFTGLSTADPHTAVLSYEALRAVAVWPLLTVGLLCLISGVVLGLGTRYGLLRYWWVAAKLAINVVFVTLVPLALEPAVSQAVTESRVTADGHVTADVARNLLFPPIVSPTGLLIAMILAVFKPWGRIGARRRRAPS